MEIGSQAWVEQSLAKLEEMEQERDQHEQALESASNADTLRVHSEAIEQLDEQIKALYAQLESVAEEAEDGDDPEETASTAEFQRQQELANDGGDDLPEDPFGSPAPVGAALDPAPDLPGAGFGDPGTSLSSAYDADLDPPASGGAAKWIVVGLLVAGGGVGGYLYLNQQQAAPEPEPSGPTEVRVIEAKAVPDDTQGPRAAEGADVDRTPSMSEGRSKKPSGGGGSRGGSSGSKKTADNPKKIKLSDSDDPLG